MVFALVEKLVELLAGGKLVDGLIPRQESGYFTSDICYQNPTTYCSDLLPGHREVVATFFLSPQRLAKETAIIPTAFLFILLLILPSLRASTPKSEITSPLFLRFIAGACLLTQLCYKLMGYKNKIAFMVMPCNVLWSLGTLITFPSVPVSVRHNLIQCWYSFQVLVWAVFINSDTSDLKNPFEVEFFWINHVLLLFFPFYYLFTSSVPALPSILDILKYWLLSCATTGIFYFGFVTPLSLYTGLNLNYMLYPPPTPPPGVSVSENFRIESMAGMSAAFLVSRLISVGISFAMTKITKKKKQQ